MRLLLPLMSLLALSASAAPSDLNGRWNISVETPRGRVWWLEVQDAAGAAPSGKFVGAPGGQVDVIPKIAVKGNALDFSYERKSKGHQIKHVFHAELKNGILQGTRLEEVDGKAGEPLPWTGHRAPVIKDKDGAQWKEGKPVQLFDGKSLSGWHKLVPSLPDWKVEDGLLKNTPEASDLVTDQRFWNFILRAEYRYSKNSNSGIGLRGRYEIQIIDDFGKEPDVHGQGALYSRIPPAKTASKAPGEWQSMEMRIVGRTLTVVLNGVTVQDHVTIDGPTAIVMDPHEDQPGPLVIQGDHGPVEFRKLELIPLTR